MKKEALVMIEEFQRAEVNGAAIYEYLAKKVKKEDDKSTLLKMAEQEKAHARVFQNYTKKQINKNHIVFFIYVILSKIFGYTFVLKLYEKAEEKTQKKYATCIDEIPEIKKIIEEEEAHEAKIIEMLDEERLHYLGSMVLGLNDALVELTGALAGYTLAMQNTRLIAMAGLITGIAATFSMAAAGYLSAQADGDKDAKKSSIYTGVAYLITVTLLIAPYLFLPENYYIMALIITMLLAIAIIAIFNMYVSVVQNVSFKQRFSQMAIISVAVAGISFILGIVVKNALGVDI